MDLVGPEDTVSVLAPFGIFSSSNQGPCTRGGRDRLGVGALHLSTLELAAPGCSTGRATTLPKLAALFSNYPLPSSSSTSQGMGCEVAAWKTGEYTPWP